jgi:acyl dehydratase
MSTVWNYLEPVRVGDRLRAEVRIRDVFVKPIRIDPLAVWIVTEIRVSNQRDAVVAVGGNTVVVHRSPDQVTATGAGAVL